MQNTCKNKVQKMETCKYMPKPAMQNNAKTFAKMQKHAKVKKHAHNAKHKEKHKKQNANTKCKNKCKNNANM